MLYLKAGYHRIGKEKGDAGVLKAPFTLEHKHLISLDHSELNPNLQVDIIISSLKPKSL